MGLLQWNIIYRKGTELDLAHQPKFDDPFINSQRWSKNNQQSGTTG